MRLRNKLSTRFLITLLLIALSHSSYAYQSRFDSPTAIKQMLEQKKLPELIAYESATQERLSQLRDFHFVNSYAPSGYRFKRATTYDKDVWIEVKWQEEHLIDRIYLIPILYSQARGTTSPYFPNWFKVYIRNSEGKILIHQKTGAKPTPNHIAPYCIEIPPTPASALRIETDGSSTIGSVGFSEIMVFSGHHNVALHQQVTASEPNQRQFHIRWKKEFLVDGFLPYQRGATTERTGLFRFNNPTNPLRSITMDLEEVLPISSIHLHPSLGGTLIPKSVEPGYGFPVKFNIEVAKKADFSDAKTIVDSPNAFTNPRSQTVIFSAHGQKARYIRLNLDELFLSTFGGREIYTFALAELEVFTDSKRCSVGKPISLKYTETRARFSQENTRKLNDGIAQYGKIPYMDSWLAELSERYDLERQLKEMAQLIRIRHEARSKWLRVSISTIIGLCTLILILFLIHHIREQRIIHETRDQIAADLHDDLGADLDTISMLAKLINSNSKTNTTKRHISEIIRIAHNTSDFTRHLIPTIGAKGNGSSLIHQLKKHSDRMLADCINDFRVRGEEFANSIKPDTYLDIILFYKEALHNIIKHADASEVTTQIAITKKVFQLQIRDNGIGYPDNTAQTPTALKRRAARIGGKVTTTNHPNQGANIKLVCPLKKFIL